MRNVCELDDGIEYAPPDGLALRPTGGAIWGRWNGISYSAPVAISAIPFMSSTSGRVLVNPTVAQNELTAVFIVAGQSLVCNHGQSLYIPHNAKVENGNIYDGNLYLMVDPVLGPSGAAGSFMGRLGDKLIDIAIADRVIIWPIGVSGTSSGDWSENPNESPFIGGVHERLRLAVNRIQALGLMPYVRAVLYQQGQADAYYGTSPRVYEPNIRDMVRRTRSYGLPAGVPWLIAKDTMINGVTYPAYRAEQAAVVDPTNGILAGPDIDTISGAGRYDGTHLNDFGNDWCAALWATAISSAGILQ